MEWKRFKNFLWLWKLALSLYLFVCACPSIHTSPVNTALLHSWSLSLLF